ncbi:MAG: acetyl-CoA carboxylase biotin carboxyl carrier protein [candidate division KSB1 bacterium]|nr:acetyl-CoA carboxylase biotin carboxyl carrier protein [candidate division KSB1 bacterium]
MGSKNIRELVKIVEQSGIDELEIKTWWGKNIRICKRAGHPVDVADYPHQTIPVHSGPVSGTSAAAPQPVAEAPEEKSFKAGNEFKAPMVGTFYCSPSPDDEPYVKEGDVVTPGQVLCIIEAMKLMNEIEAEEKGRIVEILVNDSQPVEYNQPLFIIEPLS